MFRESTAASIADRTGPISGEYRAAVARFTRASAALVLGVGAYDYDGGAATLDLGRCASVVIDATSATAARIPLQLLKDATGQDDEGAARAEHVLVGELLADVERAYGSGPDAGGTAEEA